MASYQPYDPAAQPQYVAAPAQAYAPAPTGKYRILEMSSKYVQDIYGEAKVAAGMSFIHTKVWTPKAWANWI